MNGITKERKRCIVDQIPEYKGMKSMLGKVEKKEKERTRRYVRRNGEGERRRKRENTLKNKNLNGK